ncbi:bifunctional transcriptional activator/DNA repair enzyme AdaA [Vannielia litorea]|uniref:bifunctional transcriptional activator/DNA repair enzyme AdaA n=1 Tax=Vannielia litorea TaxID=1217970 RepID=UPI001C9771A1|nr:trifunctional transcriptional activator/DNA repair protein Ada/methylated-DNA--[protein]-cysteine S-methyltransferase [Vannielia litorea]MBY6049963.1 trifunctional transcriptional activator/DNA repair protein Ada/methylated-DNA--[protein]-cysteine S-methyltransferase [Vannielia litorea]MBY6077377.1 trifunctional transcriptional activator/DNA repair protein Ada/methylated-DNA--[protein]-cysteine S-methyltransferase [Vannielia litorea]
MLFRLPDDDTLYAALMARDASYEGRALVCVRSTGIFCRLTCPARKPLRENCEFRETAQACIEAGYRACKRCRPLEALTDDLTVTALVEALAADPARRWTEADVASEGYDPSTVRRAFKRAFGTTFLEMARQRRLLAGLQVLGEGGKVIEAQHDAGFESASAFRAAFAKMLGVAPGSFDRKPLLMADWIDTPLGPMVAVSDARALHLLEFVGRKALPRELQRLHAGVKGALGFGRPAPTSQVAAELGRFFRAESAQFGVPLALHGSEFTREVWAALRDIPAGQTRSYGEVARAIGRPDAVRAVARANGANQIALVIPCHRVIGADGNLTGYGGGLWRKERLIALERGFAARAA